MIKKILSGILALSAVAALGSISASAKSINVGDIDCNKSIDIEDAVIILNHINGAQPINTTFGKALANIDCNETVDIEDAVAIINHINGVKAINVNEDNLEVGEKLKALKEKYKDGYSIKLTDETPRLELFQDEQGTYYEYVEYYKPKTEYVTDGTYYYMGNLYSNEDGTDYELSSYELRASDGKIYHVDIDDKEYYSHDIDKTTMSYWDIYAADPLCMLEDYEYKYVKTEKIGDMTYEYYKEKYIPGGLIVYIFDKNSELKTIKYEDGYTTYYDPYSYPHDTEYSVDSIAPVDKSKLDPPDLTGYTNNTAWSSDDDELDLKKGEKMQAFMDKYADGYSIVLKADSHNLSKTYVYDNEHYYVSVTRGKATESIEINSTDGFAYYFDPAAKTYYKVPSHYYAYYDEYSFLPDGMELIKTESKNGMTYEYYRTYVEPGYSYYDIETDETITVSYTESEMEEIYAHQDMMIYGFDSDSNLKTVQYCPRSELGIIFNVVSLGPVDKSKLGTPDLSGYTEVDYDY